MPLGGTLSFGSPLKQHLAVVRVEEPGFEAEAVWDLDELAGAAAGDVAGGFVLGELVIVADHAEVGTGGLIDEVGAEVMVGDGKMDVVGHEFIAGGGVCAADVCGMEG